MALLFRCSFVIVAAVLGIFVVSRVDGAPLGRACSGDIDFDQLDLVVVGRVLGWDYRRGADGQPLELAPDGRTLQTPARPIRIEIAVGEVYKMNPGGQVSFDDVLLYDPAADAWKWPGDQSSRFRRCFAIQSDPTEHMVVAGFRGTATGWEYGFLWDSGAPGRQDVLADSAIRARAREALAPFGLRPLNPGEIILAPAAGSGVSPATGDEWGLAFEAAIVACLALAALRVRPV